jgi:hypothetical protein
MGGGRGVACIEGALWGGGFVSSANHCAGGGEYRKVEVEGIVAPWTRHYSTQNQACREPHIPHNIDRISGKIILKKSQACQTFMGNHS